MPLGLKAFLINPYKRSEYASKLIDNAFESISPTASPRYSSRSIFEITNFSDLSRLYSIGDNENTIKKIIKYRKEHELTKALYKVFYPLVNNLIGSCFKMIRDQAAMRKNFEKTLAAALLQAPLEKIIQKNFLKKVMYGFKAVKYFVDGIGSSISIENEKKIEISNKKEESFRKMIHVVNEVVFKELFYAFTMIKELEIQRLQKKTAVLSFGQVISKKIKKIQKTSLEKIFFYVTRLQNFVKKFEKVYKNSLKDCLFLIKNSSKYNLKRSNTLAKTIKDVVKKLRIQETKVFFIK